MQNPIRIAIIGLGKIARDQHLPSIGRSEHFEAVLAVDPTPGDDAGIPVFVSLEEALASGITFDAAAVCTPPQVRLAICQRLAWAGCALLLEKPTAPSLPEACAIARLVRNACPAVFTAWHSRFAPQMEAARAWASAHQLASGSIKWRENPEKWHPGQDWLWTPGGLGVLDPGINALSIITALYPHPWRVADSTLHYASSAGTPWAADFILANGAATIRACFEFNTSETEIWSIRLTATNGDTLELSDGGAAISENGAPTRRAPVAEYDALYKHFAVLFREGRSNFDVSPLLIVDSLMKRANRVHGE